MPTDFHVEKRALHHPAIANPLSSQPKIVYISSRAPFISTVKRVEKLLAIGQKRELGQFRIDDKDGEKQLLRKLSKKAKKRQEVTLKATGKAIAKALEFAIFFQAKPHLRVSLNTGTVQTVDDIVKDEEAAMNDFTNGTFQSDENVPEAQMRFLPMVEVAISLKQAR
ncbi:MAG: hypothetical protein M1814_002889 [Vezdaea aestivalis]|nr:MAG: hypothetical protein M1814_002889 [Vezdaea aestivalis]